jgi:hypothetical protein
MEARAGERAHAAHIAGILRYFGLKKDDVDHRFGTRAGVTEPIPPFFRLTQASCALHFTLPEFLLSAYPRSRGEKPQE